VSDTSEPSDTSEFSPDQTGQPEQPEQLDQLETDLDTVEASLAALDTDNLDQAEALADSLSEPLIDSPTEPLTEPGGQSDESTNEA